MTGQDLLSEFVARHIGPRETDVSRMLDTLGVSSVDELIDKVIPEGIRLRDELALDTGLSEAAALAEIREIASMNEVKRSALGQGYNRLLSTQCHCAQCLREPGLVYRVYAVSA